MALYNWFKVAAVAGLCVLPFRCLSLLQPKFIRILRYDEPLLVSKLPRFTHKRSEKVLYRRPTSIRVLNKDLPEEDGGTYTPPFDQSLIESSDDWIDDTSNGKTALVSNQNIARGVLLAVSAFYGTNFSCVKLLGETLDPSLAALLRFSIAGLVFAPYVVRHAKENVPLLLGGVEVGLYSSIGYYAQAESLHTSPASVAAFICSLSVIVVPILDMVFPQHMEGAEGDGRGGFNAVFPALVATLGVAFLEFGGNTVPGTGDLWGFLQPLMFGLSFWRIEAFMAESRPGEPQAFTGAMMLTVALSSLLWTSVAFLNPAYQEGGMPGLETSLMEQVHVLTSDWHVLAAVLWTGFVTTALTSYGENFAMKSLSSAETTVIFSTEPLWGTAFAALFFGENIGPETFVGAFFIIVACLWSSGAGKISTLPTLLTTGNLLSGAALWEEESGVLLKNILDNFEEFKQNFVDP